MIKKLMYFFSATILLSSCAFQGEVADLIVHNAHIYTVDDSFSVCDAMAIKDGKIIDIGAQQMILNKYTADEVIDAQQRPVYPGFIDAHCHFLAYGIQLGEVELKETTSWNDVIEKVKNHQPASADSWIIGRGWDQNDWRDAYLASLNAEQLKSIDTTELYIPFPDCAKLDSLYPDRPVMLKRIDGHAMIVNSHVLKLAGITPETTLEGGSVGVENGKCTGLLIDNAMKLVEDLLSQHSAEQKSQALVAAQEKNFEKGLTTVCDAGLMKDEVDIIKTLQANGKLKMRIAVMLSDSTPNYDYYLKHGIDTTGERLTVRAFKFYTDGALGSRGACLLNPYEDLLKELGKKDFGTMLANEDHYRQRFSDAYTAGFQVCTHAIGDSANRVILHLYGEVLGGLSDRRWRIEHAQVVDPADLPLFGQFAVIPSVQPTHATSDMPWAWKRVGRNRIRYAYSYQDLKNQLGIIALGTDAPVEDISPFGTFYAAVARKDRSGNPADGFQKDNGLTREETLRGMTSWAAMACFEEHHKGSLEKGKYADFIILDRDIMTVPEDQILKTNVIATYVGGERVYSEE